MRIDERQARVHYVLDQAEIPTFQQIQRFDANGNGAIEGAERGPLLDSELAEISSGLELAADGRPLGLAAPQDPRLSFPSGQGGLLLTRVEADFTARLPRGARRVELVNRAFSDRIGWRAIQILPGSGTDVTSSVPATDPTDGLRSYPQDLLSSPPDEGEASFEVRPGSGGITAPPGLAGGDDQRGSGARRVRQLARGRRLPRPLDRHSCSPPRSAGGLCTPSRRDTARRWSRDTWSGPAARRGTP